MASVPHFCFLEPGWVFLCPGSLPFPDCPQQQWQLEMTPLLASHAHSIAMGPLALAGGVCSGDIELLFTAVLGTCWQDLQVTMAIR